MRPLGIAFSSTFVLNNGLQKTPRVSVMLDERAHRIGFRFHTDENDADSFSLVADGANKAGRWFQSKHLYVHFPWLGAVLKRPPQERRFPPRRNQGIWFIEVP